MGANFIVHGLIYRNGSATLSNVAMCRTKGLFNKFTVTSKTEFVLGVNPKVTSTFSAFILSEDSG